MVYVLMYATIRSTYSLSYLKNSPEMYNHVRIRNVFIMPDRFERMKIQSPGNLLMIHCRLAYISDLKRKLLRDVALTGPSPSRIKARMAVGAV